MRDSPAMVHNAVQPTPVASQRLRSHGVSVLIERLESGLDASPRPTLEGLVNWKRARQVPIHRWFRYREGFSPALISELHLRAPILDPFCGSGSIMLGAARDGLSSVGVDINPLATFVCRTKLRPLTDCDYDRAWNFLRTFWRRIPGASPWPVPGLHIAEKLFEPTILNTLMRIRMLLENEKAAVRDFLFLAWLSILQEVGNYFKEGNGIKYRNRKRMPSGYIQLEDGIWQLSRFGPDQASFVRAAFDRQLRVMLSDCQAWTVGSWADQRVLDGNALGLDSLLPDERFKSIIFSPPYANRFDYFESLKVELWFGDFVTNYDDLLALRKRSLRSHLGADLSRPADAIPELEDLITLMDPTASSWRMGVPAALRGYFDDMLQTLKQCRALLDCNGRCFVVVGNSAYAGVIVPTDLLLARLGISAGFEEVKVHVVRHLTVAPQQRVALNSLEPYMRESVLEFR